MVEKRKGFKIPRRTALLVFEEGTEYAGAEIRCAFDVDFNTYLRFSGAMGKDLADREAIELLTEWAGGNLIDWNLEDDHGAIPATVEGFLRLPVAVGLLIVGKWLEAIGQVPAPLARPSPNGSTSEAAETEVARSSQSRPSS